MNGDPKLRSLISTSCCCFPAKLPITFSQSETLSLETEEVWNECRTTVRHLVSCTLWPCFESKVQGPQCFKVLQRYQDLLTQRFVIILLKSTMRRRSNVWFLIFRASFSKGLDLHLAWSLLTCNLFSTFLLYFLIIFKGQICPSKKSLQLKLQKCKSTATNPPK